MLLSRFVRWQLVIFAILSVIGVVAMVLVYMRLPRMAGVGTIDVTVELPEAGGLYRFGNVTYRGVEVGKIAGVDLTPDGVVAKLSIDSEHRIPVDLDAEVRSVSAVGEQYVELRPRTDEPPYLSEGSVIEKPDTSVPQPVGPMLDELSALVGTIPEDKLSVLLDELFAGVRGAGPEMESLMNSASTLTGDMNAVGGQTRSLLQDAAPLIESQAQTTDAIEVWSRSLASVSGQIVTNDPHVRTILQNGPGFANETSALMESVELTLPVLLGNLTSIGQLGVTYNPGLEQLLVLLPPVISMIQAVQPNKNDSGWGLGDFRVSGVSDPPACTAGFLPPEKWRSPQETETIDTPEGLYCKLPQDSPIAVRGARNIPCMNEPGKRAPTAAMCNSEEEFAPVAPQQPLVGPYPPDPNLQRQGVTPSSGPAAGAGSTAGADQPASTAPAAHEGPSVGVAQYDPQTGNYVGPDGNLYQQSNLGTHPAGSSWQDMIPH